MIQMNLFTKQKWTQRYKKQTHSHQSGKGVRDDQICSTMYKSSKKELYLAQGTVFNIIKQIMWKSI